ncbi:MAG: hypothetical protein H6696_01730 [Deferribacteres bacterium]|nr:hypothetical protein [candidate division KSB1 bacterium]MCB9500631.1 hypothetical protein [Deferribacteres bacterium]
MSIFHYPVLLFVAAFSFSLWQLIARTFSLTQDVKFFAGGFVLAVAYNIIRKRGKMWNLFWHELTHAVWGKFFLKRTVKLHIEDTKDKRGGVIGFNNLGKFVDLFISLAPYFFPLFPLILLIMKKFFAIPYISLMSGFIGYSLTIFYFDQWHSLKIEQPDFDVTNKFMCYTTILIMHSFFLAIIAISLLDQHAFTEYFTVAALNLIEKINPPLGGLEGIIYGQ